MKPNGDLEESEKILWSGEGVMNRKYGMVKVTDTIRKLEGGSIEIGSYVYNPTYGLWEVDEGMVLYKSAVSLLKEFLNKEVK